jgi:hypothetical protein
MRNGPFTLAYWAVVILGMAGPAIARVTVAQDAVAEDNGVQQTSAREQLQHIYTP